MSRARIQEGKREMVLRPQKRSQIDIDLDLDFAELSMSAIDVLFSGHREGFDMISNCLIENPEFQCLNCRSRFGIEAWLLRVHKVGHEASPSGSPRGSLGVSS
jgi:hypothetical protein